MLYIGNSPVTFFIRGSTLDNNHIHGGLEIALSRKAYIVWVEAVKEEAVKSVIIVVTTRYMSTDMDWAYGRKRTMKYRALNLYMPTTRYTDEEYLEVLQEFNTKVLVPCAREEIIPVIGVDMNGAIGVLQMDDGHNDDVSKHSAIGPCGIGRENHCGRLFR